MVDRQLALPTNLDALSAQFRDVMGRPYRAIRPDGDTEHQAMTYPVPCCHTLGGYVRIERTTHSTSTGSTGGIFRRADHHPQVVIFAMSGKNILPGPVLMMT